MEASALQQAVAPGVTRLSIGPRLLRLRSNEQLVTLFREGDDDAFRVIHDRYRAPLLTYARHVLGASQADAEDVLQDVFVRAYRGLRAHDRTLNLSPWLYRVARNACIDELRRRLPVPYDELPQTDRAPDPDPVLAESIQRDRVRQLMADLQQLPEQQRSALILCEVSGMSYVDVAASLETSVSAVKSLLVRARLGLAQSLEARETACSEICDELADAHARGERPSALVRRHMHDCRGCREYGLAMRDRQRALAALAPAVGPFAALAKLFGFGGASSGAGAGAAAVGGAGGTGAASGGLAVTAGVVGANAAHVLTVIAATTVVAAGAIGIKEAVSTHAPARPATPAPPSYVPPAPSAPTTAVTEFSRPGAATAAAAAALHRATALGSRAAASTRSGHPTPSSGAPASTAINSSPSATAAPSGASSTKTSSSSSCAIGQQSCGSGTTQASTGYAGTTATPTGATSSKLPLGGGGSSTSTGKPHLSTAPIGSASGSGGGSGSGATPPASSSTSSSSLSSQPLGSSSSPPLGS